MASPATSSRGIARVALQPATPTVVPPTPSPGPSTSTAAAHATTTASAAAPSPASSSYDLAADAEEAERQMHRRSIYRSPGTSSSPDLATLLRRARERGGAVVAGGKKDKERRREREQPPPPVPPPPPPHGGYEQQTLRQPTGTYSSATLVAAPTAFGERPREEQGEGRLKEGTVKVCVQRYAVSWGICC